MIPPELPPLPGDPDLVRDVAARLQAEGARLGAIERVLEGLRTAGWQGPAGAAFRDRVGQVPGPLAAVAARYADAAVVLQSYATQLAEVQRDALAAGSRFESASATLDLLDQRLREQPDDATRLALEVQRAQLVPDLETARAGWQGARDRMDGVDRRCGARLRALATDALTDPALYRVLHRTRTVADGASLLGLVPSPWTKAGGVIAGGVSTTATVGLKVFYDEGSWKQIAAAEAVTASLAGARVLKSSSAVRVFAESGAQQRITVGRRLAIGSREQLWTKAPWRLPAPDADPKLVRLRPPAEGGLARRTLTRAQQTAADQWQAKVADDWQVATLSGPGGRRLLLASWGMQGAAKSVPKVQEARDRLRSRQDPSTERSEARREAAQP